ncbi:hypothetical protein E4U56_001879 [Claviceps arundinis]|uniref:Uncharacterized protein n=1 Tax=Claviceps arundinis TaxID=1623583 RepID=A0A9P7MR94_9HYPO|nr:hypothetical protein E4U56_001879 [Claviceps arundinis]
MAAYRQSQGGPRLAGGRNGLEVGRNFLQRSVSAPGRSFFVRITQLKPEELYEQQDFDSSLEGT